MKFVFAVSFSKDKMTKIVRCILYTDILAMVVDNRSIDAGGRLNKKDGLTRYGDSHVKDKTS